MPQSCGPITSSWWLQCRYATNIENKRIELFEGPNEGHAEENVLLASCKHTSFFGTCCFSTSPLILDVSYACSHVSDPILESQKNEIHNQFVNQHTFVSSYTRPLLLVILDLNDSVMFIMLRDITKLKQVLKQSIGKHWLI